MSLEYIPMRKQWPKKDSVITAFRYLLASALVVNKRVLELGCGAGEGAELLAGSASEYVGLDIAPRWSENDSAMRSGARFVQGDACNLPADWQGKFDVVIALELVEHLRDAEVLRREIEKVLAPGGLAVLSTPNFDLLSRGCDDSRQPLFEHHVREYTHDEFRDYLKEFGTMFSLCGLSQLPRPPEEPDACTMVLDDTVYYLSVGGSYPAIEVAKTEKVPDNIPLSFSQCFLGVVGNDRPNLASGLPFGEGCPKGGFAHKVVKSCARGIRSVARRLVAMFSTRPRSHARRRGIDVCASSVEWILWRRNDHVRDLDGAVANRISKIRETEDVLACTNKHIASLQSHLKNLETNRDNAAEHIKNLEANRDNAAEHIKNLEECVAARDGHISALEEQIRRIEGSRQPNDAETK